MLIQIIQKSNKISDYNDSEISAIQNLIHSHGECKHIILANRSFLQMIINHETIFGLNTRRFADSILKRSFEFSALKQLVKFYVEVNFENKPTVLSDVNATQKKLSIDSRLFSDSNLTQQTVVMCEDLIDSELYELFSNYYSQQKKLNILKTSFDARNGGGANTRKNFDAVSQTGKFCLCIIDNDKKHPKGKRGDTCKLFNDIEYINNSMVHIIDVHEAESLIPLHLISEILIEDKYPNKTIDSFDVFKSMTEIDFTTKYFFDHKEGFLLKTITELDDNYGDYWRPIIKSAKKLNNFNCINKKACPENCQCFQINGFGEKILSKALERMSATNISAIAHKSQPEIISKWMEIGGIFFSWCCAPNNRVRV